MTSSAAVQLLGLGAAGRVRVAVARGCGARAGSRTSSRDGGLKELRPGGSGGSCVGLVRRAGGPVELAEDLLVTWISLDLWVCAPPGVVPRRGRWPVLQFSARPAGRNAIRRLTWSRPSRTGIGSRLTSTRTTTPGSSSRTCGRWMRRHTSPRTTPTGGRPLTGERRVTAVMPSVSRAKTHRGSDGLGQGHRSGAQDPVPGRGAGRGRALEVAAATSATANP